MKVIHLWQSRCLWMTFFPLPLSIKVIFWPEEFVSFSPPNGISCCSLQRPIHSLPAHHKQTCCYFLLFFTSMSALSCNNETTKVSLNSTLYFTRLNQRDQRHAGFSFNVFLPFFSFQFFSSSFSPFLSFSFSYFSLLFFLSVYLILSLSFFFLSFLSFLSLCLFFFLLFSLLYLFLSL